LKITVGGSYPKISEDPAVPNLRNTLNRRDQGKAGDDDVQQVYTQTITRVIREQEDAGVDEVTDGLIRWDDLADPVTRAFDGMHRAGLLRFFDNNAYYRQPLVDSPVVFHPATVSQLQFARSIARQPVKAVLPGPYTLAALAQDTYYHDHEKLVMALAEALHQEALALQMSGASHIQLDEPSLCAAGANMRLAQQALQTVVQGLTVPTSVFVYFGGITNIVDGLFSLPVTRIGVDCVSRPGNLDAVLAAGGGDKDVVLGLVDARNTKMETEKTLAATLARAMQHIAPERLWVSPSCGLEFLPHDRALAKLRLLSRARQLVEA
jgi:5-methyltetrahydropteroyltriglutamate--homocysteine methyltransferase